MLKTLLALSAVVVGCSRCGPVKPYYYGVKPESPAWEAEIVPILKKGCGGDTCHEDSQFTNNEISFLQSKSKIAIEQKSMPPGGSIQSRKFTEEDAAAVLRFYEDENKILEEMRRGKIKNPQDLSER